MRVVFDTNIFVSALLTTNGTAAKLLDAWRGRRFTLVSHQLQLDELREVTRRAHIRALIRPATAGHLVNLLGAIASAQVLPQVERSPDPADNFLLALSQISRADWLITGDKRDLLILEKHGSTRIATAAQLAAELGLAGHIKP